MTVAINITSLTGQRTVFIDTVSKNQVSPSSSNGIALLRYIPTATGSVQGDVYADTEDLIRYSPFTVEIDVIQVDYVNIYCSKVDPEDVAFNPLTDWIKVGEKLDTTGTLEFELLDTDFSAGEDIWVKVEDWSDSDIYDVTESSIQP